MKKTTFLFIATALVISSLSANSDINKKHKIKVNRDLLIKARNSNQQYVYERYITDRSVAEVKSEALTSIAEQEADLATARECIKKAKTSDEIIKECSFKRKKPFYKKN